MGKRPVWSQETLPVILTVHKYHSFSWTIPRVGGVVVVTGEGVGGAMEWMRVGFVESWLDRAVCRWPLTVATDLGKFLRMSWDESPGQVEKNPAYMATV